MSRLNQLFALLTVAVIAGVGDARSPQPIIGGTVATLGEFPYQVSLRLYGEHICGGSIIGKRHIITAAHCVAGVAKAPYNELRVATGTVLSYKGSTHSVKKVVSHAKYNTRIASSPNDIAIIELKTDIQFDENQDKIELPTEDVTSGVEAVATGWGMERSNQRSATLKLMKIKLKVLDYKQCQRHLRPTILYPYQLCTFGGSGHGVCEGDSGGPLAYNNTLIGLVSFGIPCGVGFPDVYTNVYHYLDWIKTTIDKM